MSPLHYRLGLNFAHYSERTLKRQISSGPVYSVAPRKQKAQLPHFQIPYHAMAPSSTVETKKIKPGCTKNLLYHIILKPLQSSNDFWAKSFSQTLPFNRVAVKQTGANIFRFPGGVRSPSSTELGVVTLDL